MKQIDISGRFGAIDYNRELEAIAKFSQSRVRHINSLSVDASFKFAFADIGVVV